MYINVLDFLVIFSYSSVTGDVLYKEPLKLFTHNPVTILLLSKYNLLMKGLKIYIEKKYSSNKKRILISNFNIFKST